MRDDYFFLRHMEDGVPAAHPVPAYLLPLLPDKDAAILDFGCGLGQLLDALATSGFRQISGAEINAGAIQHLRKRGLKVHDLATEPDFFKTHVESYDFIVMSHVLEHLPKPDMSQLLTNLRSTLKPSGSLLVMVPNAQSNTGGYWAYEDFTHTTLFTTGSLFYVLRAAGFSELRFVDVDCTAGMSWPKAAVKKGMLALYKANRWAWNKVTSSAYHAQSPPIFSYEIKALARK